MCSPHNAQRACHVTSAGMYDTMGKANTTCDTRDGISVCVVCGYSLHGLSECCRCPECGTAYDDATCLLYEPHSFFTGAGAATWHALCAAFVLLLASSFVDRYPVGGWHGHARVAMWKADDAMSYSAGW